MVIKLGRRNVPLKYIRKTKANTNVSFRCIHTFKILYVAACIQNDNLERLEKALPKATRFQH